RVFHAAAFDQVQHQPRLLRRDSREPGFCCKFHKVNLRSISYQILRLASLAQDDRSRLPLRSRLLSAVISTVLPVAAYPLPASKAQSRPVRRECPPVWLRLPPPPSWSAP